MKIFAVSILTILISFSAMANSDQDPANLAWPMIEDDVLLLDVRSPEEFEQGHIKGPSTLNGTTSIP